MNSSSVSRTFSRFFGGIVRGDSEAIDLDRSYAVDIRIQSVRGLPTNDPNIVVHISSTGDPQCDWSSASLPSFNGIAYIGAWTTMIVRNFDTITIAVQESAPGMKCLAGASSFYTSKTIHLPEYHHHKDIEMQSSSSSVLEESTKYQDIVLELDERINLLSAAAEKALIGSTQAADELDKKVARHPQLPSIQEQGDEVDRSLEGGTNKNTPNNTSNHKDSTNNQSKNIRRQSIFTLSDTITLDISIAVNSLDVWMTGQYRYRKDGGSLEVGVQPLKRSLHSYAHGGFMGLACSIMGDSTWIRILKEEDSAAYKSLYQARLKLKLRGKNDKPNASQGKYMMCLENSPVLVAYGLVRSGCTDPAIVKTDSGLAIERKESETSAPLPSSLPHHLQPPPSQVMAAEISNDESAQSHHKDLPDSLKKYQMAMERPNRYGYLPLANEWDLWVHPHTPSSLIDATILHGSQTALVSQAITTSIPGLKSCAKRAGLNVILDQGLSPIEWLTRLGNSINFALNSDVEIPLELHGDQEVNYKLNVFLESVDGYDDTKWEDVYVHGHIESSTVVLPDMTSAIATHSTSFGSDKENRKTKYAYWNARTSSHTVESGSLADNDNEKKKPDDAAAAISSAMIDITNAMGNALDTSKIMTMINKNKKTEQLSFWPLPFNQDNNDDHTLTLILRGDPKGVYKDRSIAQGCLSMQDIVRKHPDILQPLDGNKTEVEMEVLLTPPSLRAVHKKNHVEEKNGEEEQVIKLKIRVSIEAIGVIDAAVSMGVPPSAAQTAIAMLSSPGGLYLDIKSAYSSARDIQLFVSTMKGVGLTCKAVCSFKPEQLLVGTVSESTVLFFHGLSGVENACDAGRIRRGQFVLFNGASFLQELSHNELSGQRKEDIESLLLPAKSWPIDTLAVRKYLSMCQEYGIVGGIYIQEPDTAPSCIDALCTLVNSYADAFPLGFAYGHCSGKAPAFFDSKGRGFASQQILEEFSSRKDLSGRTVKKINAGEHITASMDTLVVWAARLLHGSEWMDRDEQRAFCAIICAVSPEEEVMTLLKEAGGIRRVIARFHDHYELTTPLTLLEAGFNYNYSKSLLRILRNKGVYARMSFNEKVEFAHFICGSEMRGYGLTYVLQTVQLRRGLHKHAKEGLTCILESCTADETAALIDALGGEWRIRAWLRGRLRMSWHYMNRWNDVNATHKEDPNLLAYKNMKLKYAALIDDADEGFDKKKVTHTREKSKRDNVWRNIRKSFCCGFTVTYALSLEFLTVGTFMPCCVYPRCVGTALKGACGIPAIFSFIVGFLIACAIVVAVTVVRRT